jgi:hypothetical protein
VVTDALEHLDGADRRERVAADSDVPLDDGVLEPHLDRIEPELLCELVEERLDREGGRRRARPAIRAEGEAVRLDAVAAEVVRLPAVRAGDEERGDPFDAPAGVRAAVDDHPRLDRGQRAVLAAADTQVRHLCRSGVRRLEVLCACEDDANRSLEGERRPCGERLDDRELAAEGAAERFRDHADALEREAVRAGELALGHEGALRRRGHDERPVGLEPGGRDLGLDVRLVDPRRPERARGDGVARVEKCRGIADVASDGVENVVGELLLLFVVLAAVDSGVDRLEVAARLLLVGDAGQRRAGLHRLLHVDDRLERLVLDHDRLHAVLGRRLAVGDDDRNRLACEDDLVSRERLRGAVVAGRLDREVGGGEDRDDAGHGERGILLDAANQSMRLRREHEPSVQETVDPAVGGEARGTRHPLRRVDAGTANADHAVAHRSSFARSSARSSALWTTTPARWRRYSAGANSSP